MTTFPCFKCNGSGSVAFKHVAEGVCFQCKGSGRLSFRKAGAVDMSQEAADKFYAVASHEQGTAAQWAFLTDMFDGDEAAAVRFAAQGTESKKADKRFITKRELSDAITARKGILRNERTISRINARYAA